jgi:cardiolipin synthase
MDVGLAETTALVVATLTYYGVIAAIIVRIILQRRDSPSTLAWIFFLLLVPGLGVAAFWVLGGNQLRLRRWRSRHAGATIGPRLEPLTALTDASGDPPPFPADRGMLELARRLDGMNAQPDNAVELYRDGALAFDALEAAIDGAQHHVHAIYYIWLTDRTGERMRDALVRACQRGVQVRLLLDDVGSYTTPDSFFGDLVGAGGQLARFLPLSRLGRRLSLNHRNHRKVLVVDGKVGFTGGMNIGDDYAGIGAPWSDAHIRVDGPAVHRLQEIFCQDWYESADEDLAQACYFPDPGAPGAAWVQFVDSGPHADRWNAIHTVLFAAVGLARERVWLETPYFIPDRPMALALAAAALRGVDVRLLLPGRSDHPLVLWAGRSYYSDLLEAGVKIYELPKAFLHAKTACFDGVAATVGSANMDQRSFGLNFEANALVYDQAVAASLERSFLEIQAKATPVDPEVFAQRGRVQRLLEASSRLLSPII